MSVLVQADDFNRSGTLSTPWTVKSGDAWFLDGYTVRPHGTPSTFRRAVMQTFDPFARVSRSTPPPVYAGYQAEVQITAPDAFSATEDLFAGITFMSSGANGVASHFEVVWRKVAASLSSLVFQKRSAAGVVTALFPIGGIVLPTVNVGEVHTLNVAVTLLDTANAQLTARWDSVIYIGVTIPSLSANGFNGSTFTTATHYAGIVATVPGPADSNGNPLYPVRFDNFRFRDVGPDSFQPALNPTPALTADPVLASVTMSDEDDSGAETLDVQPSYVHVYEDQYAAHEHRFDGGYVQTISASSGVRRKFALRWNALSSAQRTTLLTLEAAVEGKRKAFTWVHPETGETLKVRFTTDLVIRQVQPTTWAGEVEAEEVRA